MLRTEVINYENLNQCDDTRNGRLLVRLPVVLGEELNPDNNHLDIFSSLQFDTEDTDNYLYLRLFPEYTQENEFFGEGNLKNTFNSAAVYAHSTVRRGFQARVKDRRILVLNIIRKLILISRTTSYEVFTPIKVVDYCLPEPGQDYTIRYGSMKVDSPSGTRNGYLNEDWEIAFKETILRDI